MVVRTHPRFPVSFSSVLIYRDKFTHSGTVRDLSIKGCRVESVIETFAGMQLVLRLRLPEEATPIIVDNAAVRWSGSHGMGLEFLTITAQHQERLSWIIQRLERKPAHG